MVISEILVTCVNSYTLFDHYYANHWHNLRELRRALKYDRSNTNRRQQSTFHRYLSNFARQDQTPNLAFLVQQPGVSRLLLLLSASVRELSNHSQSCIATQLTIYDECHTQSAMVLAESLERAYHNNSNDKPKVMYEFQSRLPLLWIAMNRDKPLFVLKGT